MNLNLNDIQNSNDDSLQYEEDLRKVNMCLACQGYGQDYGNEEPCIKCKGSGKFYNNED